ncbi:MAG TPA: cell wall hydrolase [Verrucomicrobiae bacterium]
MKRILLLTVLVWAGFTSPASAATYGQKVVAAVLLAEARGEGETGMVAVAEVIRRRADQEGVSPLRVVKPGAFSSLNGKTHDEIVKEFYKHPQFSQALRIARTTYNEPQKLRNITRGATHFTHKKETPYWAVNQTPVAVIGNHAFYRLDSW